MSLTNIIAATIDGYYVLYAYVTYVSYTRTYKLCKKHQCLECKRFKMHKEITCVCDDDKRRDADSGDL